MDSGPGLVRVFKHDRSIMVIGQNDKLPPCLQRGVQPLFQVIAVDAIQVAEMAHDSAWLEYLDEIKAAAELVPGCLQDIFILGARHHIVERCMQSAAQPFIFQEFCPVEKVLMAESIHSISCKTDFRVNSMITDNGFVFAEISKGYIDKALGNDVAESGFHDPVCYCEFGKKPDDFFNLTLGIIPRGLPPVKVPNKRF